MYCNLKHEVNHHQNTQFNKSTTAAMTELTKEEIDDLRASFDMFDCDKSGA
jgi:Ca2+-binding EF-hand superfamily protein